MGRLGLDTRVDPRSRVHPNWVRTPLFDCDEISNFLFVHLPTQGQQTERARESDTAEAVEGGSFRAGRESREDDPWSLVNGDSGDQKDVARVKGRGA